MDLAWMAWTKPTAIFFITIFSLLMVMIIWERISPGGTPRVGILRFETTRGDRLFISLLGSAYLNFFCRRVCSLNCRPVFFQVLHRPVLCQQEGH